MSEAFLTRRGGGMNLNFRVSRYPLGTDLAGVTGKTNEIAVLTDTPFSEWYFGFEEPVLPTRNMIWILTDNVSTVGMNALKKNGLMVYPTKCSQYIEGAWVQKEARTYYDGAWHEWRLWLFGFNGEDNEPLTGGWEIHNRNTAGTASISGGVMTVGTGTSTTSQSGINRFWYHTIKKIDLTKYTKLKAHLLTCTATPVYDESILCVRSQIADFDTAASTIAGGTYSHADIGFDVEVDISSLSGTYYVGIMVRAPSHGTTWSGVWLE